MTASGGPYAVLGLPAAASAAQVRSAYRKLAKKYHPDLNPGDQFAQSKFLEVHKAYDSIMNGSPEASENPWSTWRSSLSRMVRPEPRRRSPGVHKDIMTSLAVSLGEAYFGAKVKAPYVRVEFCEHCDTTGFDQQSKPRKCFLCSGTGRFANGSCWICGGQGQEREKCQACHGAGWVRREAEAELQIPPKMPRMYRITTKKAGNRLSRSFPPGDLHIHVSYRESDRESDISVQPDGSLLWKMDIPWHLSLSGRMHVVYPFDMGNPVTIPLRADAEDGHVYVVENGGMVRGKPLLVKVSHALPTNITQEDVRILTDVLRKYGSTKANAGIHEDNGGRG
jgi:molecular chaperone DnaJ